MFRNTLVALLLSAGPAVADELTGLWTLTQIDGTDVAFTATLDLTEPGKLSGQAPCNSYGGKLSAEDDAFIPGPILTTKMACDGLADENRYLQALQMVETMALEGDQLTLTGEQELVFSRAAE